MGYKVANPFTANGKEFKVGDSATRESVGKDFADKVNDNSLVSDAQPEAPKSEPKPNDTFNKVGFH